MSATLTPGEAAKMFVEGHVVEYTHPLLEADEWLDVCNGHVVEIFLLPNHRFRLKPPARVELSEETKGKVPVAYWTDTIAMLEAFLNRDVIPAIRAELQRERK